MNGITRQSTSKVANSLYMLYELEVGTFLDSKEPAKLDIYYTEHLVLMGVNELQL